MRLFAVPALADNYIWVVADALGAALAVDPGEAAPVEALLQREDLHLHAVLLTHHHGDHTAGAAQLAAGRRLRIIAPCDERITAATERVRDGDAVTLQEPALRLRVIEVPGHTSSHIAFFGDGLLFCGDTLFSLGCGRLFEGSPAQMLASLETLARLPGDTRVCCGHEYTLANAAFALEVDPHNAALQERQAAASALRQRGQPSVPSTIAHECAANPFLRIDSPALRAWTARHAPDASARSERFGALRRAKDEFRA